MDGNLCCDVLQHQLKPSVAQMLKKIKFLFQQDLAPRHTSNTVKEEIANLKLNVPE